MFHRLLHYFIHEPPKLHRRPRQFINEYDIKTASHDEQLLMKAIQARSPEEAKRLMLKYKAANIYELLAMLRDEKPSFWQKIKNRAISLWMRIEGASSRHPIDKKRYRDESKIDSPYVWGLPHDDKEP